MDVLVIEDVPSAAEAMRRAVERLVPPGFDVRAITDPRQGSFASILDPGLKCVLLDYLMPEMDGKKVAEEILRVRPNLRGKIIITSGYDYFPPGVEERLFRDLGCRRMTKPVDLDALKAMIDEILAMP